MSTENRLDLAARVLASVPHDASQAAKADAARRALLVLAGAR